VLGADVVTVGTIIGALIGTVTFLLRILVAAKSKHIESLEKQLADVMAERNLFRDISYPRQRYPTKIEAMPPVEDNG
jgi:hypothetical protein